jgi:hypothetical protein
MGTTAGIRELEIDYPLAFANTIAPTLKKPFKYVHLSGAATERDQSKSLWFKGSMRKTKVYPPSYTSFHVLLSLCLATK